MPQAVSFLPSMAKRDGPGHAFFVGFVVEDRFERRLGRIHVRSRGGDLELGVLGGVGSRSGLDGELGEGAGAVDRASGAAERQVRVVEQFEAEGRDGLIRIDLHGELHAYAWSGHSRTGGASRPGAGRYFCAAGGDVVDLGPDDRPGGQIASRTSLFPGGHPVGPVGLSVLQVWLRSRGCAGAALSAWPLLLGRVDGDVRLMARCSRTRTCGSTLPA